MKSFVQALCLFSTAALANNANKRYNSGEVKTHEKFKYGKFRTRMRGPGKKGTVSSFFTFYEEMDELPEHWNEIDVELVPSLVNNPFTTNIIYSGRQMDSFKIPASEFDPSNNWHEYEIEWKPNSIAWSVDGV